MGAACVALSIPLTAIVTAGSASAVCHNGSYFDVTASFGSENPQSGTCDADEWYTGRPIDTLTDGYYVYVKYNFSGSWVSTPSTGGYGSWYQTYDSDGVGYVKVCRSDNLCTSSFNNYGY